MTMPCERLNSLLNARKFLVDLLDPKKTPRVPKEVRKQAYWVLRHYPSPFDIQRLPSEAGDLFELTDNIKKTIDAYYK